jgi:hypothetical protein
VNPIERPPYQVRPHPLGLEVEVTAPDARGLLSACSLAASDVVRPLGRFGTWTARRVTGRGDAPAVVSAWLSQLAADFRASGFLPALVEFEKVDLEKGDGASASGIFRGGAEDPSEAPPAFPLRAVPAAEVRVVPGTPWRARFVLAR